MSAESARVAAPGDPRGSSRSAVPSEQRIFSLILALVASPQGLNRADLLSTVHGYSDRFRHGIADAALERQFERDKSQLRELGIPLETVDAPEAPGDPRFVRYRISKHALQVPEGTTFTAGELALLRLAAIAWAEGSLTAESRRATMKIEALGAGLDVQHLGLAPRLGSTDAASPELRRAIEERRIVRFAYHLPDRDAPLERRVAPLRLHRAEGRWHLIGHDADRGADRVFLLSRIVSPVRVTAERFSADLLAHADAVVRELHELLDARRAQIRVRPGSVAETRLGARAARASGEAGAPLDIGTLDYHELARELAAYGDEAAVLAPDPLRTETISLLARIRDQHREGADHGA